MVGCQVVAQHWNGVTGLDPALLNTVLKKLVKYEKTRSLGLAAQ